MSVVNIQSVSVCISHCRGQCVSSFTWQKLHSIRRWCLGLDESFKDKVWVRDDVVKFHHWSEFIVSWQIHNCFQLPHFFSWWPWCLFASGAECNRPLFEADRQPLFPTISLLIVSSRLDRLDHLPTKKMTLSEFRRCYVSSGAQSGWPMVLHLSCGT